jgi:hypothetical protein
MTDLALIKRRAKALVDGMLGKGEDGREKDPEAAERILRSRVKGRVDPLSRAITAELDRRASVRDPLAGWLGWE